MSVCGSGDGASGRLEGTEVSGNADCGLRISAGEPALVGCTLRDHAAGKAAGVYVGGSARGAATAGLIFARNAGGDVVRE